jgi:hypothetical protein
MQLYPYLILGNRAQSKQGQARIEAPYCTTIRRMTESNEETWPTTSRRAGFHLQPNPARWLLDRAVSPKQKRLSRYQVAVIHRS